MRRIVLLIVIYLLPRIVVADSILVLGDSLSAAFGFELDQGWVHLLQTKLSNNDNRSWQVINASVAGETTAGGLARLPQLLELYKPNITILALGANDGLRGQSIQHMRANLTEMVTKSQQFGTVVLLGMRLPPNYGKAYIDAFVTSYESVAHEFATPYVPFFIRGVTENVAMMQADNFHPNAAAQETILNNVWPTILATIQSIENQNK